MLPPPQCTRTTMVMVLTIEICCFEAKHSTVSGWGARICIQYTKAFGEMAHGLGRVSGHTETLWAHSLHAKCTIYSPEGMLQGSLHYQPKPMQYQKGKSLIMTIHFHGLIAPNGSNFARQHNGRCTRARMAPLLPWTPVTRWAANQFLRNGA